MSIGRELRFVLYTLILVAILKSCAPAFAEEPWLTVDVTPRMSMTPINGTATVRLLVTVPRNDQNRLLCVGYDGPTFRSSCAEHVEPGARYRVEVPFSGLREGAYVAFAELHRAGGAKGSESRMVTLQFEVR